MDTITLIGSLVVIILLTVLVWALFTQRTNAKGIWLKVIQVCQAIDKLPISGAIMALLRDQRVVALIISLVIYIASALNPALYSIQDKLFVVLFTGWALIFGAITWENYTTAKYSVPTITATAISAPDALDKLAASFAGVLLPLLITGLQGAGGAGTGSAGQQAQAQSDTPPASTPPANLKGG